MKPESNKLAISLIKKTVENFGFCFRCEHRVKFLERKARGWKDNYTPRCECSMESFSSHSCYMYCPVQPVVMKQEDKKDVRPFPGPPMFSARGESIRPIEPIKDNIKLSVKRLKDGMFLYWVPEEVLKAFVIEKIKVGKKNKKKE